jgi:hypothetical protein
MQILEQLPLSSGYVHVFDTFVRAIDLQPRPSTMFSLTVERLTQRNIAFAALAPSPPKILRIRPNPQNEKSSVIDLVSYKTKNVSMGKTDSYFSRPCANRIIRYLFLAIVLVLIVQMLYKGITLQ